MQAVVAILQRLTKHIVPKQEGCLPRWYSLSTSDEELLQIEVVGKF